MTSHSTVVSAMLIVYESASRIARYETVAYASQQRKGNGGAHKLLIEAQT